MFDTRILSISMTKTKRHLVSRQESAPHVKHNLDRGNVEMVSYPIYGNTKATKSNFNLHNRPRSCGYERHTVEATSNSAKAAAKPATTLSRLRNKNSRFRDRSVQPMAEPIGRPSKSTVQTRSMTRQRQRATEQQAGQVRDLILKFYCGVYPGKAARGVMFITTKRTSLFSRR